ncbi:MAG: AAA family ATPase, partial [Polyangiaceae bacterium]|nr:AAA family ATPase [Polyangiaceae bacterium]
GTVVFTIAAKGKAGDLAFRAARAALAARAASPRSRTAITIGRAAEAGGVLVGEAADRASEMMTSLSTAGKPGDIGIDPATARLLADRFLVRPRENGALLVSEHAAASLGAVDLAGPFVGRERELDYLHSLVREATNERHARTILVTGAAGSGKSRLARELLGRVGDEPEIWVLQGDSLTASTPFGMLRPFLRKHAGITRGESGEAAYGKLHDVVASVVAGSDVDRITEFLAELATVSKDGPQSRALAAAQRDATLMGDQMRRALTDFIAASSTARPLVIVVEDLQWSDRATLSFLEAALRILEASPLCLIGLARPEAKADVVALFGDRSVHEVRLEPLPRAASLDLASSLLGRSPSDDEVGRIVDRAGGNPFFLEELVRASAAGSSMALPSSVLSVLEGRLEALPPEARRTMRAASVFGRSFWQGGLAELLPKVDVASHLDLLDRAEIIRRSPTSRFDGQIEWTFRHSLLSEASYARLPEKDRQRAHRAAARWLEEAGESDPTLLAEHYERGGEGKSAIGLLAGAAHLALEATDLELCITLSERAIRCGATGAELGGILADDAEARQWLGQNPEAVGSAQRALGLLEWGSTAWCRAATVAMTAGSRTQDREAVSQVLDALLEMDTGPDAPSDHLNLVAQAAIQLVFLGSLDAADRVLARTPAGLSHRDPGQAAWLLRARAWRALAAGDPAAYGTLMRHSAIAFSEVGDMRNACVQHVNVAYAAVLLGQYEDALSGLRAVIEESKSLGLIAVTAVARHNLGIALARAGQMIAGEAEERAAVQSFRSQGDRRMLAASLGYLAEILALRGDLAAAEATGRQAVDESPERSPVRAITLANLASVLLQRVVSRGEIRARPENAATAREALEHAQSARSLLDALGGVDEGEGLILATYARALAAVGRIDEARAAVSRAAYRVRERADRVGESHQANFLDRVPENVVTLALEEALEDLDE